MQNENKSVKEMTTEELLKVKVSLYEQQMTLSNNLQVVNIELLARESKSTEVKEKPAKDK